jgi:hypothetical protein
MMAMNNKEDYDCMVSALIASGADVNMAAEVIGRWW